MKKLFAIVFATLTAFAGVAHATVETFDSGAQSAANGFQLSSNIHFTDAGRPFLEFWDQSHTITSDSVFSFNSIDFNIDPWSGYNGGSGNILNMKLLDAGQNVLLDAFIALPTDRQWLTYSNNVANVSSIYFAATNGFWPSFDNLTYNEAANNVPEPATLTLLGLGLLGFAAARRKSAKSKNV